MTQPLRQMEFVRCQYTHQLKQSLECLKRDIVASIGMCAKDFGVLGDELLQCLRQRQVQQVEQAKSITAERKRRMHLHAKLLEVQGNIRVVARVRPLLVPEVENHRKQVVQVSSDQEVEVLSPVDGSLHRIFSFSRVFDGTTSQHQVFEEIAPLVVSAMDGFHACIFAYGQTGSGKTHTMQGPVDDRGVYYRATQLIFELAKEQAALFEFEVILQMVEIYNEEVYDLLGSGTIGNGSHFTKECDGGAESSHRPLVSAMSTPVRTPKRRVNPSFSDAHVNTSRSSSCRRIVEIRHGDHGVYLKNVDSLVVTSAEDVHCALDRGNSNRSMDATNKNEHSSRSHSVVLLDVQRRSRMNGETHKGRLVLVDLAGSERLSKTDATGSRLKEAQHINRSLSAVGDVMAALLAKEKHIPFRNSKLTHLLQDSLSNQNKALMLVQVSPTDVDVSESINTLKFASRVSLIQLGSARRSERVELHRLNAIVSQQSAEMESLKKKLANEIELRKKCERRCDDYRRLEEQRKRIRDEETKKRASGCMVDVCNTEMPEMLRRWSLYSSNKRDDHLLRFRDKVPVSLESVKENVVQQQGPMLPACMENPAPIASMTPVRRSRRLSLLNSAKESNATPSKRKPTDHLWSMKSSILKKRRTQNSEVRPPKVEIKSSSESISSNESSNAKQVTFQVVRQQSPGRTRRGTVALEPLSARKQDNLRTVMPSGPTFGPPSRIRTATVSTSAFGAPPGRVPVASAKNGANKPRWNSGWR